MKTWSRELSAPLDTGRTAQWFDPPLSVNAATLQTLSHPGILGSTPIRIFFLFLILFSFRSSIIQSTNKIVLFAYSSYYRKFILISFWVLSIISSTADILDWFVSMIETSDDNDEPCRTSSEVSIPLDSFQNIK